MLPDYVTVLVGVLSGLGGSAVGGVVGARLQIQHERDESFRNRMIEAADDFSTGFGQAMLQIDTDTANLRRGIVVTPGALVEISRRIDEATARSARIDLLFGLDSTTAQAANKALKAVGQAHGLLSSTAPDIEQLFAVMNQQGAAYGDFTTAARDQIDNYRSRRPRRLLRRGR